MTNLRLPFIVKTATAFAIVVTVLLSACKKDNDKTPKESTIATIVSTNNDFSLLKTALVQAGLTQVLSGTGPFTVFAPNNAAFVAAGLDTEAKIKAVPVETLKQILLYHVLGQRVPA